MHKIELLSTVKGVNKGRKGRYNNNKSKTVVKFTSVRIRNRHPRLHSKVILKLGLPPTSRYYCRTPSNSINYIIQKEVGFLALGQACPLRNHVI